MAWVRRKSPNYTRFECNALLTTRLKRWAVSQHCHSLIRSGVCLSPLVIIIVIIEVPFYAIAVSGMPLMISIMESKYQYQTAEIRLALKTSNTQIAIVHIGLNLREKRRDNTYTKRTVVNMTVSLTHTMLVPVLVFRIKLAP